MELTVVCGTFGEDSWQRLAQERALPSVPDGIPTVHVHGKTLTQARNACLEWVETEFVVHLDADDQLEPGYIEAMARGSADVRAPMARYIRGRGHSNLWQPRVFGHRHDCEAECLRAGNWILIGAAARTDLVREVGWTDFAWSEDWALWAQMHKAGASFELIRDAVYRAHVRMDSRNRGATDADKLAAHRAIERFVWPEDFEEAVAA